MEKTREDLLRNVDCNVDCQHKSRNPVCGTNGRNYDSRCDLERDICKKVKVQFKHEGECSLAEKCIDERRAKQDLVSSGEMVYVPTCEQDGSYSAVQCHNFTFYCWCSLADGVPSPRDVHTQYEIPKRAPRSPRRGVRFKASGTRRRSKVYRRSKPCCPSRRRSPSSFRPDTVPVRPALLQRVRPVHSATPLPPPPIPRAAALPWADVGALSPPTKVSLGRRRAAVAPCPARVYVSRRTGGVTMATEGVMACDTWDSGPREASMIHDSLGGGA
ncbi:putative SPARC-related modular calcium-binding protein 2 [Penaeus vannamei]|uniref:Putative SPARC-related modular calcium-binding protein 2 n=1 Tax=Penaeus vannamei TaxID=6689 RepID=A0A423TCG5_PENVA|nr:putative SPARC-related modular calcium-binding protein 2 [Penaeus vannamei]